VADAPEHPDPDEMQKRLDDLGEGIEKARKQAEDDSLLPTEDDPVADGPPLFPDAVPRGDQARETPVDDSDTPPGG
jgi:hypothetical protein